IMAAILELVTPPRRKMEEILMKCQRLGFLSESAGKRPSIARLRKVALGPLPGSPAAPATSLESGSEWFAARPVAICKDPVARQVPVAAAKVLSTAPAPAPSPPPARGSGEHLRRRSRIRREAPVAPPPGIPLGTR